MQHVCKLYAVHTNCWYFAHKSTLLSEYVHSAHILHLHASCIHSALVPKNKDFNHKLHMCSLIAK